MKYKSTDVIDSRKYYRFRVWFNAETSYIMRALDEERARAMFRNIYKQHAFKIEAL